MTKLYTLPEKWWNKFDIAMAFFSFVETFGAYAKYAPQGEEGFIIGNADEEQAAALPDLFECSILTDEVFTDTLRYVH